VANPKKVETTEEEDLSALEDLIDETDKENHNKRKTIEEENKKQEALKYMNELAKQGKKHDEIVKLTNQKFPGIDADKLVKDNLKNN
jgi:hypothetical protein